MKRFFRFLPLIVICLSLAACAGKDIEKSQPSEALENTQDTTVVPEDGSGVGESGVMESDMPGDKFREAFVSEEDRAAATDAALKAGLKVVHFDFDKYTIKESDLEILQANAQLLKDNPGVYVRIEGHADERGENEYNMALGEKRAMSVKHYLESLGVSAKTLSIISYGEESPAIDAHNEEAWAANRRVEFEKLK
ncbi:MAG: peptidoglycan-associated lipoprotein Pal [Thermodesulfobacteriota bacterium]